MASGSDNEDDEIDKLISMFKIIPPVLMIVATIW